MLEIIENVFSCLKTFPAYSGTTIENFRTCTFVENGTILFDKSREPKHTYRDCYFTRNLVLAQLHASRMAQELDQAPLIMFGRLSKRLAKKFESLIWLPQGICFSVDSIWVSKEGIDWRPYQERAKDVRRIFQEIDPKVLLNCINL